MEVNNNDSETRTGNNAVSCEDCGAAYTPNGFLADRGWVCRECGMDPNNPNNTTDMPSLDEITIN